MPDIGLLRGAPPRRQNVPPVVAPADVTPGIAPPPAEEIAARFEAPVDSAITVQLSAAPAAAPETPRAPEAPPADLAPVRAAPPAIRNSDLLWLALALLVMIGTGIGIRDPWPADEPRFAVVARDMVATGEWLFPRVGGDLYQDKPPLFFWMLAACYSLLGSIRWSFLIPAFLGAGGVLFLVYDFGRRMVSREAGLAGALTLVCTLHFVMVMRGAQIDPVLCGFVTLSMY